MAIHETGIHGGAGLAARRLSLGPSTLVTTASDHVAIRTPSRPDFAIGNGLHLFARPSEVTRWLDRCDVSVGALLGAPGARVSWEEPGAPGDAVGASGGGGTDVLVERVLDLGPLAGLPVADGIEIAPARTDTDLAGAAVQYLHAGWPGPQDLWRWWNQQQAEVAQTRGRVLLARVHGLPVGRVAALHDAAGLGTLVDLVVHPLYRRGGVGAALAGRAASWLAAQAGTVVAVAAGDLPSWATVCPVEGTVVTVSRAGP